MHFSRWGDPERAAPLGDSDRELAEAAFGARDPETGTPLAAVRLADCGLTAPLLAELEGLVGRDYVLTDHGSRVRHTRGKSTPDLLRMRSGDAADAPDAVVLPQDHEQVAAVVSWCSHRLVALVPFGGGTSVVGGLVARREGYAGVVALDVQRLNRLLSVDSESRTATLEAGVLGPAAEALLGEHDLTLGHFPQSFEYASIGGFAATRSSGQASTGYGRFDSLVVGVRVATPLGTLDLGSAPSSAAGPDLRELVLGSEGAFGVITSVRVRVRRRPEVKAYYAWRFASFFDGADALRGLQQSGIAPTVLRLSDETETAINDPDGGCLLIAGFEGGRTSVDASRAAVTARLREVGGRPLGAETGAAWAAGRFDGPYLRDSFLDAGVLVETLETATFWSDLRALYDGVRTAVEVSLSEQGTTPIVLCHISHVYETGASLYFTVAAKQTDDPLAQWAKAKSAASEAIVAAGATITHHHAVGRDHKPWLEQEIGLVGVQILRAVKDRIDPAGVLNPGVLIP